MMPEVTPRAEVERLHRFFDDWFAGRSGLSIDDFADAIDPLFTIVGPDGASMGRDEIVEAVRTAFGRGGVSITVDRFEVADRGGYVLCRYQEVQTSESATTRRISTAVMERDSDTPGGFRWITVHETWTTP